MTIMFEVDNLQEASPATVSRCGMIYIDPESIDPQIYVDSFVKQIHEEFEDPFRK